MIDLELRQHIHETVAAAFADHEESIKRSMQYLVDAEARLLGILHETGRYVTVGGEVKEGITSGISDRSVAIERAYALGLTQSLSL